jgi:hypothetical protein
MIGAFNGTAIAGTMGSTDASGTFSISGSMPLGTLGNWTEAWYVGGRQAMPVLAFTVTVVPTLQFSNLTGSSNTAFHVGDAFKITITGAPNQPVTMVGAFNGTAINGTMGSTDTSGTFSVSGSMPPGALGNWMETWYVEGVQVTPVLAFTVIARPTLQFTNLTGASNTALRVGDAWKIIITGAPNQPVTMTGTFNGVPTGGTMGSTDAGGTYSLSGAMGSGVVGTWIETWYVGGVAAIAPLSFTVTSSEPAKQFTYRTGPPSHRSRWAKPGGPW